MCVNDDGLRVWGEGSEQNLRHVLLAKGHQEQCQALIGRVYTATLKQRKRRGDVFQQPKQHTKTSWRRRLKNPVTLNKTRTALHLAAMTKSFISVQINDKYSI